MATTKRVTLLSGSYHDLPVAHTELVRLRLSQHLLKASQRHVENQNLEPTTKFHFFC